MLFEPLRLDGAWLVAPERMSDERGFFARIACVREFSAHGLNGSFVQSSLSHNRLAATVRGMHFQWPPSREAKLVRCIRGRVHDILLDLRPGSSTFLQHSTVSLDERTANAVYIPSGFAHGFQTLTDDALVQYHMTDEYQPLLADGYRWNDPTFSIALPLPVAMISDRDANYPDFEPNAHICRFGKGQAAPE